MVVPSKTCDLRGSGDTVCGLCALISGSHGKGYYTTAASVFALAPEARHDPTTDILCRPFTVPRNDRKYTIFFKVWRSSHFTEPDIARQSLAECSLRGVKDVGFWFRVLPAALWGPGSLSVKEPVSSLPQIYGDASAKLSHMAFLPAGSLCWGYKEAEKKGGRLKSAN